MKTKSIIAFFLILPLVVLAKPISDAELKITPELSLEKQVELFTIMYGGDAELNKKIISCESKWNVNAVGDSGRSTGIAQFQKPSFYNLAKLKGEKLDYNSSYDQIKLMVWSIANGHGNQWTAYRAIKNGGKYSFYSNQLKRHFTVYCR